METIFTLILVLLPVIFKLIGKRLENAGTQPQAIDEQQPIEDWAEVLRRHIEAQQQEDAVPVTPVQDTPVQEKAMPATKDQPRKPLYKPAKPILQEEDNKKKEKIDTKKLIVYSEIMKPKYTE